MQGHGGFEHNLQSLRVVDTLEERYAAFNGLNLSFETREGILKHCALSKAAQLGEIGARFINDRRPSLEAQITNLADEIAYNNHDVDDGLRSGLLTLEQLSEVRLFEMHHTKIKHAYPTLEGRRVVHETVRNMINTLVTDLIEQTARNISAAKIQSLDDVRVANTLATFSESVEQQQRELKKFLHTNLYGHYRVMRMSSKAKRVITELFSAFMSDSRLLPPQYQLQAESNLARAVADYVAGMTDRYAIKEYRRLFAVEEE
jgi:dGTPase